MAVIELLHLQKHYGEHIGIQDVSFSVNEGELFGFVGPNGAGKSTTIKVLLNFIFAQSGTATICGLDAVKNAKEIRRFTGYVPSDVRLYPNMYVGDLLKRNAAFYDGDYKAETDRLCNLFEVDVHKRFHELSTGNKKKVAIICALMANPHVIVLDEPTNGLDPVMQKTLFQELKRRARDGASVLLSSHNLAEVEEYCERVAFIKEGQILAITDLANIVTRHKVLTVTGGNKQVPKDFVLLQEEGDRRVYRTPLSGGALLQTLSAINPTDFTLENESMEAFFWDLYKLGETQ